MRFLGRSLSGLFLLAMTMALLVWAGVILRGAIEDRLSDEPRRPPARERVFAVDVITATPQEIVPVLSTFGEVRSRRTLDIRASASGRIMRLHPAFEDGGAVSAGEELLRIDARAAEAALARVQVDLRDAQAESRDATRNLELAGQELQAAESQVALRATALTRQQNLVQRGVGAAASVEAAELALASAEQTVLARRQAIASAQTRLDQSATRIERATIAVNDAERALEDTVLTAGFDGVLSGVSVTLGAIVGNNERLAQLVDPDALEVSFRLSSAQYARLLDENGRLRALNARVVLDVFGVALESQARVTRDDALVDAGETGRVIFAAIDSPKGLKPGDFVTVEIDEPALERVVSLPARALSAADKVLYIGADERLEEMEVTLLRRQDDTVIVRARGLAGRAVVTVRTPLLGVGIKVRPIARDAEGAPAPPPEPEMLELSEERRAKLIAFVEGNQRMPAEAKKRVLAQLSEAKVPAQMVERLESRMGG